MPSPPYPWVTSLLLLSASCRWSQGSSLPAVTGSPAASCITDADCSFNGVCSQQPAACECDPAWEGPSCGSVRLLPTTRTAGLRATDDGQNTSTWGGTVSLDSATGLLHMWASEMAYHCGIASWKVNSFVVHAVASADGVFKRASSTNASRSMFPIFTHEPSVSRGPNGEWVLYWSGYPDGHTLGPPCTACTNGSTPKTGCTLPRGGSPPTYMAWSVSPDGPWSIPVQVLAAPWDTNLAVVIRQNGSVVGVARRNGMPVYLVTAADWKNASSYQYQSTTPLFQLPPKVVIEDGSVYLDANGRFHAIFHAGLDGIHTFSEDGVQWTYGGPAWDNNVTFANGETYTFHRRERPHFVFGDAANPHRITALTTAVSFGDDNDQDSCYTLLQPVNTA